MAERKGFQALSNTLIQSWPEGLIGLNADFHVVAVSPTAESLLGYQESELLNRSLHSALCSSAVDYRHTEEECPVTELFNHIGVIKQCEAWWLNKPGAFINVNVKRLPLHYPLSHSPNNEPHSSNACAGSLIQCDHSDKDPLYFISFERCPSDGFSATQTERLAQYAENNPMPMAEISASGAIEYANPSMMKLLVDPGFDEMGRPKVFPDNLNQLLKACFFEDAPIHSVEQQIDELVIRWSFTPVYDTIPPLVHAYGQDISEIRKAQALLETAFNKAQVATKTKSQFLANMSHEIRTPLTAIIGYSESIWDGSLHGISDHDAVGTIISNGKQMLQIVNNILDLSKIEAQRLEVEKIPADVGEILNHIDYMISLQAQDKLIDFRINVEYPFPIKIHSDPVRIKQVLLNLCSNAIKFTHHGFVCVSARFLSHSDHIQFSVQDSGIGIAPEKAKSLFQAFSQADASTTRHYGGTGLGLYISKQLCEILGGSLEMSSHEGVGSTFTATFSTALSKDSLSLAENSEALFQRHTNVDLPKLTTQLVGKVLIAEDYIENQRLVEMYLTGMGISVTAVNNGEAAIQQTEQEHFDLILMDIQMPGVDGLEAAQILRLNGFQQPIVALTANIMKNEVEEYLQNGFDDCIGKPIDRQQLMDTLTRYLKQEDTSDDAEMISSQKALFFDATDEHEQDDQNDPAKTSGFDDFYDSPIYQDLIDDFLLSLPREIHLIEAAIKEKNWASMQRLVHRIKGAGGSFGFDNITVVANEMDSALKAAENELACSLYPALEATVHKTMQKKFQENPPKSIKRSEV